MWNKITQILSVTLVLCGTAQAGTGKFTLVAEGGKVPFEATCFDNEATAQLLTWKEYLVQEQQALCNYEKERISLDFGLIVDNLNITLDETRVRYQVEIDTRDEEIEKLREIIKKNKKMNIPVVVASSVAVGVAIGFGSYHMARR